MIRGALVVLGALAGTAPDAAAQADNRTIEAEVNIPYLVQFGLGSYDVGGLSVTVFQVPLRHTFPLGADASAPRLVLTAYLGYSEASFESGALGTRVTASQDFAYVLPHAELQIPVGRGWTIKPYVAAGLGRTFDGSVTVEGQPRQDLEERSIALYAVGVGGLYEIAVQDFLVSFGTRLAGAWDVPTGQSHSTGYGTFQSGVEVRHPLGLRVRDRVPDIGVSLVYYHFFPAAKFSVPGESPLEVSDQLELGFSVGSSQPAKLWIFENPRLGVSYRFGDGLTGVRVNFGFPF